MTLSTDATQAVRSAMHARGMTQADLARSMGVFPSHVSRILRGEANLTTDTLDKLANAIGVRWDLRLSDPLASILRGDQ